MVEIKIGDGVVMGDNYALNKLAILTCYATEYLRENNYIASAEEANGITSAIHDALDKIGFYDDVK